MKKRVDALLNEVRIAFSFESVELPFPSQAKKFSEAPNNAPTLAKI
jgi:hypothetical protein